MTKLLSDKVKATIDSLSKEELRLEINKKNRSRFQNDSYAYLQARLANIEDQEKHVMRKEDITQNLREYRLNKVAVVIAIFSSVLSLAIGGGWYQEFQKTQRAKIKANNFLIEQYLAPIATLLNDNRSIYNELSERPYSEPGWGILESYLIKIRRDGVSKNALMRKRIDSLVQNNETIITLLTKYVAYIKTDQFRLEANKFRDHAIRYSDRWKALIEVFVAKGKFPTNAPIFPVNFPKALQDEIELRRNYSP